MLNKLLSYLPSRRRQDFSNDEPIIQFLCEPNDLGVIPEPVPAFKHIPDWFKKIPAHMERSTASRDTFGAPAMTAKKCLPLLDGMSAGYTIPLFGDMHVRTSKDNKHIELTGGPYARVGEQHPIEQLGGKTSPTYPGPAIKFINRWAIKTAPGWSSLFITPINHFDKRFTCLGALVDTDVYPKQVNFPAVWHLPDYDDTLRAGTPLVTVIPVRRADLARSTVIRAMTQEEHDEVGRIERVQHSRSHYYTEELREPRN